MVMTIEWRPVGAVPLLHLPVGLGIDVVRCSRCRALVLDRYDDQATHASWHRTVEGEQRPTDGAGEDTG